MSGKLKLEVLVGRFKLEVLVEIVLSGVPVVEEYNTTSKIALTITTARMTNLTMFDGALLRAGVCILSGATAGSKVTVAHSAGSLEDSLELERDFWIFSDLWEIDRRGHDILAASLETANSSGSGCIGRQWCSPDSRL